MPYLNVHGTQKPPLGAQIDPEHPFAKGLMFALLFQRDGVFEGAGSEHGPVTYPLIGLSTVNTPTKADLDSSGSTTAWRSNIEGTALYVPSGYYLTINNGSVSPQCIWIPTSNVTVCVIRRKTDTTNRASALFGVDASATVLQRCGAHVPFSDGTVYWDFGDNSGANRLSVAGLTFSTRPERWIFTAGARGSAIWQNGVKVASQATAIARTVDNGHGFFLNNGNGGNGDEIEFNYFAFHSVQWSDDLCRWWSAEPYAHLYGRPMTYSASSTGRGTLPTLVAGAAAAGSASPATVPGNLVAVGVG